MGDFVAASWQRLSDLAAITAGSSRSADFAQFGSDARICFPLAALHGEQGIRIGAGTVIGPYSSLSAGMVPGQELVSDSIVTIGSGCVIGRHSSIVGHLSITIGDNVFFGPNVYVTDQNHSYTDRETPIGHQASDERPVVIGQGSWIGTNSVILPGVTIGRQVVVGAGSVVVESIPDYSVAVGSPARVVSGG